MINIKGAMRGEFIREKIGVDEDRKIKRRKDYDITGFFSITQ